jgi:hypothetical protein
MTKNSYAKPAGDLNHEVQKILEVPPNWRIRNGGYLMLSYVLLIWVMFTFLRITPVMISPVTFDHLAENMHDQNISVTMRLDQERAASVKTGTLIHFTMLDGKRLRFEGHVKSLHMIGDSALIKLSVHKQSNGLDINQLKVSHQYRCKVEMAKVSIMTGILRNTLNR